MGWALLIAVTGAAVAALGYHWRHRSLACPANVSWLLDNPFMNALAGPNTIFRRIGLEAGMKVLDVGCGTGRLAVPAAAHVGDSGEVTALDLQEGMLAKLTARASKQGVHNIRTIHAAAGSGAVGRRDYFDRALLITVLGEIPNKEEALAEIFAALKGGGLLSVTEMLPDPHYQQRATVRTLCREAGFREAAYFGSRLAFTLNFVKPEGK